MFRLIFSVILGTSALMACGKREPEPAKPAPDAAAAAEKAPAVPISTKGKAPTQAHTQGALGPAGPTTVRSTHPDIYLKNLRARRKGIEVRTANGRDPVGAAEALAHWHIEQMALDGDFQHVLSAEQAVRKALPAAKDPKQKAGLERLLAGLLAERHRFAEAKTILQKLIEANPDDRAAHAALLAAQRNLGEVNPDARPPFAPRTYNEWGDMAIAEFLGGRIEAADLALRRAHAAYPDVHPIPLAWIDLQRGLLRLRTGRHAEARDFFANAYKRLPQNWVVAEHLAETETLLGNHARALELYDAVVKDTNLPEFMVARAGVLEALGRKADAEAELERADKRWRELLDKYGVAVAGHAVEFFLSEKPDLPTARKWVDENLKVRRDAASLVTGARVHAALGDTDRAKALLEEASRRPPRTDEFFADLADAYTRVGDAASAKIARAQALQLNPKAEVD